MNKIKLLFLSSAFLLQSSVGSLWALAAQNQKNDVAGAGEAADKLVDTLNDVSQTSIARKGVNPANLDAANATAAQKTQVLNSDANLDSTLKTAFPALDGLSAFSNVVVKAHTGKNEFNDQDINTVATHQINPSASADGKPELVIYVDSALMDKATEGTNNLTIDSLILAESIEAITSLQLEQMDKYKQGKLTVPQVILDQLRSLGVAAGDQSRFERIGGDLAIYRAHLVQMNTLLTLKKYFDTNFQALYGFAAAEAQIHDQKGEAYKNVNPQDYLRLMEKIKGYDNSIKDLQPDQAETIFDAFSRAVPDGQVNVLLAEVIALHMVNIAA